MTQQSRPKSRQSTLRFVKAPLALAVALGASQTVAQGVLEEIIVTAEHREETLQDTQISMAALSSETIRDLGISNGLDIGGIVPNVNAQPYVGGRTGISFNIRGIGNSETLITFDPAVSVYLDGVLIAKNTGSLLDVLDLERIEVLRGPQGTLYGRNTMGGAINYITRKPSEEFEGNAQVKVGNYGRKDVRGMLNLPLLGADSALGEINLKLNGGLLNRDGLTKNTYGLPPLMQGGKTASSPQSEIGTVDREVFTAQLQWTPTDSFSATYMYDYTKIDEAPESPWTVTTNPDTFFGSIMAPYERTDESKRPSTIAVDHVMIAQTDVEGHSLNLNWELSDNLTLISLTGFRDMFNYGEADSDGTPITTPPILNTRDQQEYQSLSQEFRLLGSGFDTQLDYSLGLYYMDEEGDLFNETAAAGGSNSNVANYENEAWAVYGQGTYNFSDALSLTVGGRYTEEDRMMDKALVSGTGSDEPITVNDIRNDPALSNLLYPEASNNYNNFSWLVSLGYNWSPDVMTYAKISTGFQSGGFNARDILPSDFVRGFDEETITAYELGLKSTLNNRFQINGAIFYSDYDDKRVNQFDPVNLVSIQRNAGVVEIYGAEVELLAQLTEHWRAGVNYGYTHKDYVEYEGASGEDLSDAANFPYSPDNTASANLTYEHPMSFGLFKARVDWSYRDNMTFLTPQPERNASGPLQLWNARIALEDLNGPGDSTMSFALWGKNLMDEGYYTFGVNIYNTFGFDINTYGEPMTWGMDIAIDF